MKWRERLQPVLDGEIKRWRAKSCDALLAELARVQNYRGKFENKEYQVEVRLLENTDKIPACWRTRR